jgi:hypothetical protein
VEAITACVVDRTVIGRSWWCVSVGVVCVWALCANHRLRWIGRRPLQGQVCVFVYVCGGGVSPSAADAVMAITTSSNFNANSSHLYTETLVPEEPSDFSLLTAPGDFQKVN